MSKPKIIQETDKIKDIPATDLSYIQGLTSNAQTQINNRQLVPTVVTGTLTTGDTSITLSNSAITTSSIIDVYTDTYGIAPKTVVASTGSVTLTFKAQSSDLGVRVEVR